MQATLAGKYAPRDGNLLTKEVGGELVIVDMQSGVYHGLNAVGVQIWERFDGERTLNEIVGDLAAQYPDVERERIETDTLALTQELLNHGLVVPR